MTDEGFSSVCGLFGRVALTSPIYLTPDELVSRWNGRVTKKTLSNWRAKGEGPEFMRFGNRILYPLTKIEEYEERQLVGSAKEHKARRRAEKQASPPATQRQSKPRPNGGRDADKRAVPVYSPGPAKAVLSPPDLPGACKRCGVGAHYTEFEGVRDVGVDATDGRYADVGILRCRSCSALWLRYRFEVEAFSGSGRWYRGLIDEPTAISIKPEDAYAYLSDLPAYAFGGSFFGHDGAVRFRRGG